MTRLHKRFRLGSITQRVTAVAVVSAASGGLLASAIAVAAVDTLIARQLDQRLLAATFTLADELDEEKRHEPDKLRETLDDENEEIASSGIVLSVFEATIPIAGDPDVTPPTSNCESHGSLGRRTRVCARPYGSFTLIARQSSDVLLLAWTYFAAATGAVVLGAAVGGVLSRALTFWAVGSLTTLKRAIEQTAPDDTALPAAPTEDSLEVLAVRTALERQMQRSHELLQQARRFASNAAHELRTPLTTLRTELELMAEETARPPIEVLTRSCQRVEHLSALVERLLILTVPVEHAHRLFETTSLSDVVEGVLERLSADAQQLVQFESCDEGLVRGDAGLLATLVDNGVANALKYAPNKLVRVTVSKHPMENWVRLMIQDEGPGVPSELRDAVFEPFFRASPNHQGHGLGLALVSHIAQIHAGRAWFDDVPAGAQLVIDLPAWAPKQRRVKG